MDEQHKKTCGKISRNMIALRKCLSEAAFYEQLAEECSELAHIAQKKARKLRGENYTPMTMEEIDSNLIEEITDVELCRLVLCLTPNIDIMDQKVDRWFSRVINDKYEKGKDIYNGLS